MMILETTGQDYASLIEGRAPRDLRLADTPIASSEILEMLAGVAAEVGETFSPVSWLIVCEDEVVGLCSITRPPQDGVIDIGYGIAPSRQGRGHVGAAIRDIVRWAEANPAVQAITAETSLSNIASERALERAGFARTGERWDEEDGQLRQWRRETNPGQIPGHANAPITSSPPSASPPIDRHPGEGQDLGQDGASGRYSSPSARGSPI